MTSYLIKFFLHKCVTVHTFIHFKLNSYSLPPLNSGHEPSQTFVLKWQKTQSYKLNKCSVFVLFFCLKKKTPGICKWPRTSVHMVYFSLLTVNV